MIVCIAQFKVKPGKKAEFISMANECIQATRKENGNIGYYALQSPEDEDIIFYVEQWESMDAVLAHLKAEHYVAFSNKSAELRQGQPSVNLYDASPINLNR